MIAAEGGRVTELMARPLLNLHVPQLAGFEQPLAGETAARRELLEAVPFPAGYGVEIALLIDALRAVGLDGLAEARSDRQNRHQPLRELGAMAFAVLVRGAGARRPRSDAVPAGLVQPWADGAVATCRCVERPPLARGRAARGPGLSGSRSSDSTAAPLTAPGRGPRRGPSRRRRSPQRAQHAGVGRPAGRRAGGPRAPASPAGPPPRHGHADRQHPIALTPARRRGVEIRGWARPRRAALQHAERPLAPARIGPHPACRRPRGGAASSSVAAARRSPSARAGRTAVGHRRQRRGLRAPARGQRRVELPGHSIPMRRGICRAM